MTPEFALTVTVAKALACAWLATAPALLAALGTAILVNQHRCRAGRDLWDGSHYRMLFAAYWIPMVLLATWWDMAG